MGSIKQTVRSSCEGSSMKALPKIVRAQTTFQRILWVLALLVGLVAVLYQLIKLLMGYLEFATSVNIVTEKGSPPFPDVTVCHLDPNWTFRVLKNEIGEELSMAHYVARVERLQSIYGSDTSEWRHLEELKGLPGYLQNEQHIHAAVEKLRNLFIIDCYFAPDWDHRPCFSNDTNYVDTSVFIDPMFGLCVTFQTNDAMDVKSLNIILYLDDPEVSVPQRFDMGSDMTTHTSVVGARVVIHPPKSFPDIFLGSQHVHAGVDIAFNLEGTRRTVLDDPYGSCISTEEAEMAKKEGKPGYSINRHGYECYRMCAKDHILFGCKCIHLFYATSKEDRATTQLCGHLDEHNISKTFELLSCASQVEMDLYEGFQEKCTCPIPCQQFTYEYSTKSIEWPHDIYHLSFYDQYIRHKPYAAKFKDYESLLNLSEYNEKEAVRGVSQLKLISKNFAQIRILNHQKTYFHFSETPLISPEALFGNVGGLLNLWVGITFITIIEIVEFLYQLCVQRKQLAQKKMQNGNGNTGGPEPTEELLRKA